MLPILKSVFVGDERTVRPEDGAVTLHNISTNKRAAGPFPHQFQLILAAWFTGRQGKFRTRVDVVRASDGETVFRSQDFLVVLGDPLATVLASYVLRPTIPAAGIYTFELFCENQFMDDQLIEILPAT
jgi:hypothetical protein